MTTIEPGTTYDVMTPVDTPTRDDLRKTTWVKVGSAFADREGDHVLRLSLLSLPVGTQGPVRLFIFPKRGDRG